MSELIVLIANDIMFKGYFQDIRVDKNLLEDNKVN